MQLSSVSRTASLALAAGMIGTVAAAMPARADSFVPDRETEIDVGLGCLVDSLCVTQADLADFGIKSITSLVDATTGTQSRLFVDDLSTLSTYANPDANFNNDVEFQTKDAGTNFEGLWFRPSTDEEKGQLEVGTFKFEFLSVVKELTVDFFDTESSNSTGAIAVNGEDVDAPNYVAKGKDGNIVSQVFAEVSSLTLKLGNDTFSGTGDGVDFRITSTGAADVPEPGMVLGLAALAAGGAIARRRSLAAE